MAPRKTTARSSTGKAKTPPQGRPVDLDAREAGPARRPVGVWSSDKPAGYQRPANPLEGVCFKLDGDEFYCRGELDLLDKADLAALSMSSMDVGSPQGMAMIGQFLQLAFGAEEYRRFRIHVKMHQTPEATQLAILGAVAEAARIWTSEETGRPTSTPQASSPGRPGRAEEVARVISLDRGDVSFVPIDQVPAPVEGTQTG